MTEKNGFLPVLFLTLIVLVSVAALIATDEITREPIAAARRAATHRRLQSLFPAMDAFIYDEASGLFRPLAEGDPLGLAFVTHTRGFGGTIAILIGLAADGAIRGIEIVSHRETPGLGAQITEPSFLDQFKGIEIGDIALSRDGGTIDAITAATISAAAVAAEVLEAVSARLEHLE